MNPRVLVCGQKGRGHILDQNSAVLFSVPALSRSKPSGKAALLRSGKIELIFAYYILRINNAFSLGRVPMSRSSPFFVCSCSYQKIDLRVLLCAQRSRGHIPQQNNAVPSVCLL